MKGLIPRAALCCCGPLLLALTGCYGIDDLIDPCWPERYNCMARQEVNAAMAPQVQNGHVLDQTVWNWCFEYGTDKLHPAGIDRLIYIARRRPHPDTCVYLETAHDILWGAKEEDRYNPEAPEKWIERRLDLDARRVAAVQKFLTAYTAGRHLDWHVSLHDPADPGMSAVPMGYSVLRMYATSQGALTPFGAAGGAVGGGGIAGPAR